VLAEIVTARENLGERFVVAGSGSLSRYDLDTGLFEAHEAARALIVIGVGRQISGTELVVVFAFASRDIGSQTIPAREHEIGGELIGLQTLGGARGTKLGDAVVELAVVLVRNVLEIEGLDKHDRHGFSVGPIHRSPTHREPAMVEHVEHRLQLLLRRQARPRLGS